MTDPVDEPLAENDAIDATPPESLLSMPPIPRHVRLGGERQQGQVFAQVVTDE